jgi:protein-disulfide isomerase
VDQSRPAHQDDDSIAPEGAYQPLGRSEPTATIPRATFNLLLVGVVAFALGLLVGVIAYDRIAQRSEEETTALINRAVQAAVAAAGAGGAQAGAAPRLDPGQRYTIADAGNPSIGPADAPVQIVEFGDFRCGFCKRFHDETRAAILERYTGRVRLIFRDYPILGQSSIDSANAAECADDQGKFWEYQDLLYANQASLVRDTFIAHAQTLGMDVAAFTTCYDEQRHQAEILADYRAGEALGVGGTPTFFINGRPLIGAQPIDAFANLIDEELGTGG